MLKITFMGAGSTVFAKNVLGDSLLTPAMEEAEYALFDIDHERLADSERMLKIINANAGNKAKIVSYTDRKEALRNAKYVVNAIQVGGYEPCTVTDFEIPKKYGLRQTIGDTLGIGGIFRALRTIPVLLDFARDMQQVCPDAWFINYSNPMAMLTGAMLKATEIRTVGLCHSVQGCCSELFRQIGMDYDDRVQWKIAGINHMAWLLEVSKNGVDLYPEIKKRAQNKTEKHSDMVRFEIMKQFGYYVTESSEHNSEYMPYFIKKNYPEIIEKLNIPLDEYPRRCVSQIDHWKHMREDLVNNKALTHERSHEYASYIIEAMETNKPFKFGGNVLNLSGVIENLPKAACVEVPCIADASGIVPCHVGSLPTQLAALNMTNINVQMLTIEAALTRKRDKIYQAAMLDPHTAAELSIDDIRAMVDDLIAAHGSYLPTYQ